MLLSLLLFVLNAGARSAMGQAHALAQYARVMASGVVILMSDFFCTQYLGIFLALESFGIRHFFCGIEQMV